MNSKSRTALLSAVFCIAMSWIVCYPAAFSADESAPPTMKRLKSEMASEPATIRLSQDGKKGILVEVIKGKVTVTSEVKVLKGNWTIKDPGMQFDKGSVFRAENTDAIQLDPSMNIIVSRGKIRIRGTMYDQGTNLIVSQDGKLVKK
ncbi:MAG TPA: hypothetical protein VMT62_03675 [Syntrophorhabdaceae bacterium]|nr:hypothetical protein [Syntrophorhabdaceae bacterium]